MNVRADYAAGRGLIQREARDIDVLAEPGDFGFHELADRGAMIFCELLFVERFVRFEVGALPLGDLFEANELRFGFSDVRGDIGPESLKVLGASDKVRFAIYFDQHAELGMRIDEGADKALLGVTRLLLAC